jgi:hypothetical protein
MYEFAATPVPPVEIGARNFMVTGIFSRSGSGIKHRKGDRCDDEGSE